MGPRARQTRRGDQRCDIMRLPPNSHAQGRILHPREHRRRGRPDGRGAAAQPPRRRLFPGALGPAGHRHAGLFPATGQPRLPARGPGDHPQSSWPWSAAYKKAGRPVIFTRHANSARRRGADGRMVAGAADADHPLGAICGRARRPGRRGPRKNASMTPSFEPISKHGCARTARGSWSSPA